MTTFVQIHSLMAYPASNLNRDDSGRPKTMMFGGVERLRISSQSEKRALRTSPVFQERLAGSLGTRAQSFGRELETILREKHGKSAEDAARMAAAAIEHDKLGKLKIGDLKDAKKKLKPEDIEKTGSDTEQLAFLAPEELDRLRALATRLAAGEELTNKEMLVLVERPKASDIALFGRMLADNPSYNVEAACQVAHAFTTHRATVEDDYFTAVDELKARRGDADKGAGFVGVQEFGAGTFYLYACLDAGMLVKNLAGDRDLAARTAQALVDTIGRTGPAGKQNAFASRGRAHWMLVETGTQQPRTLGTAFQKPIAQRESNDVVRSSIERLHVIRDGFSKAYGQDWNEQAELDIQSEADDKGAKQNITALCALAAKAVRETQVHD